MIVARPRLCTRILAITLVACSAFAHAPFAIGAPTRIPQAVAQRVATLDCERVGANDVRDVLSLVP
ncbi:MAG TPA: hypothetical protein VJX31_08330, partial [Casimicrobiaceae bacterium]|nr:hypothetical protein [Casimicrobiaceae bacterium]